MIVGTSIVIALLAGMLPASIASQQIAKSIPAIHGTTLSGDQVDLPQTLKGRAGVLVLGFSQASRGQVTAWGKRLAGDYRDSGAVIYYEMPMLESVPRLLRGWVLKKIGESVPERAKARFLPVVDHEAAWKAVAGVRSADDAYVLVIDGDGNVMERLQGPASDELYARVKMKLEALGTR